MNTKPIIAVAYVRVSTAEQTLAALSGWTDILIGPEYVWLDYDGCVHRTDVDDVAEEDKGTPNDPAWYRDDEEHGEGGVRFHEIPPPSPGDVAQVARRVRDRAVRWLGREGYIDRRAVEDRGNETPEPSAIEACTQLALAGGAFLARPREKGEDRHDGDADLDRKERRFSALCDGFDVHCAVRIAAGDDQGRERIVRYCTRPPFALDRIEVLGDGRIAYRVKTVRRGRTHHVRA